MNQKAVELLELPKILERVAALTSFSGGRELVLSLAPSADIQWIEARQRETSEARALLALRPNFSLGGVHDVRPAAGQAAVGGLLQPHQLQDLKDTLQGGRIVQRALERVQEQVPVLWRRAQRMPDCQAVENEINRCIGPRGEVLDGASPALSQIRVQLRHAHDRLTDRLQDLVNSARGHTLLQEPVITLRSGRYVVPVKADFRGEFRGIVHDMSASGATVFMEPLETLELGNTWRQLQIDEEREVERVLRTLSGLVGDYRDEITETVEVLAHLDLTLAKGRYGDRTDAVRPQLGGTLLRLVEARHPLLSGNVVPISFDLGYPPGGTALPLAPSHEGRGDGPEAFSHEGRGDRPEAFSHEVRGDGTALPDEGTGDGFHVLVITGPNTGGKTVSLKTAGLLVLMAQAGLPVPCAEASLPVYREVFADIGDEQSIEQSLSTFSSHMTHIIDILGRAGRDSLVLLDELGAGTDPTEGSALGRAIVAHLVRNGVPTIATTHHSDLKAFAHGTPGVRNASVEFDPVTLSPTYKLQIGLPGWSNAIAIASRLGLPEALVAEARSMLDPQHVHIEQLLADIQQERAAAIAASLKAHEDLRAADESRRKIAARLHELESSREAKLEEARQEVTRELERLRSQLRAAERDIERALREQRREELLSAAAELRSTEGRLTTGRLRPARRQRVPVEAAAPPDLTPGSQVRIAGLGQVVEVVSGPSSGGEVEVQMGAFRARVRADQLEAAPRAGRGTRAPGWSAISVVRAPDAQDVESELHLRGIRVEEALRRLDEYLDQAFRAGYATVRVVHGKGTGAMRQAVREVLAVHPLVRSFETAASEAGGDGVTIAFLAQ